MPERKYEIEDVTAEVEAVMGRIAERGYTPLQEHFGDWVADASGLSFATQKERAAFVKGASTALALRMLHQRSPENHAFKEEARAAREQEAAARPKRATKAEAEAEEEQKPRRGRPRKAAAEPAEEEAASTPRRGRRAAAAKTETTEASAPAKPGRRPAAAGRAGRPRRGANKAEADF